jgi:ABC-2 type transport system ATP-binding protein
LADPPAAIETRGLTKTYPPRKRGVVERLRRAPAKPPFTALSSVDLVVRQGELYGLLGPNGAGKTTLVKILSTLLLPTSGDARVLGLDVRTQADEVRRRVGVVLGGDRALYWRLTARENLWYFSQLYDMPGPRAKAKVEEVLSLVGLTDRADDKVENYSKGMKQRLHIARGLLTDPEILLLDEPTIGLDPHAARTLRDLVRELVDKHGRTVVLTTHYMYEADELSDRIGILHKGRIIAQDTPAALKAAHAKEGGVVVRTRGAADDLLARFGPTQRRGAQGDIIEYRVTGADGGAIASALAKEGIPLVELRVDAPTLEDVFVELTGEGAVATEADAGDAPATMTEGGPAQ